MFSFCSIDFLLLESKLDFAPLVFAEKTLVFNLQLHVFWSYFTDFFVIFSALIYEILIGIFEWLILFFQYLNRIDYFACSFIFVRFWHYYTCWVKIEIAFLLLSFWQFGGRVTKLWSRLNRVVVLSWRSSFVAESRAVFGDFCFEGWKFRRMNS